MKKILVLEETYKLLFETIQLADKEYFKTGILTPEDREVVLSVTNGDYKSKAIADYLADFPKIASKTDKERAASTFYNLLSNYEKTKQYLPIEGLNLLKIEPQGTYMLKNVLEKRERVINDLKKFDSKIIRNLKPLLKFSLPDPYSTKVIDEIRSGLSQVANLVAKLKSVLDDEEYEILIMKAINSNKGDFDSIVDHLENMLQDLDKELHTDNLLEKYADDIEILRQDGGVLVLNILTPDAMRAFGCNSQWCFSEIGGSGYFHSYSNESGGVIFLLNYETDEAYVFVSNKEVYDINNFMLDREDKISVIDRYNLRDILENHGFEVEINVYEEVQNGTKTLNLEQVGKLLEFVLKRQFSNEIISDFCEKFYENAIYEITSYEKIDDSNFNDFLREYGLLFQNSIFKRGNGKDFKKFAELFNEYVDIHEFVQHIKTMLQQGEVVNPDQLKLFETSDGYSKWKRKNVTLRGMKSLGVDNGVWGSFGRGLYTVPLSNKSMAKQYGDVYFVVNAIPKNPKVVDGWNNAELWRQDLVEKFCKEHGVRYSVGFFEEHTSIEEEMLKLGYDGLVIKGREMVNYAPENVKFFRTEDELKRYFENLRNISESKILKEKNEWIPIKEIMSGYIEAALWTEQERLEEESNFYDGYDDEEDDYSDDEDCEQNLALNRLIKLTAEYNRKPLSSFEKEHIDTDSIIKAYRDIKLFISNIPEELLRLAFKEQSPESFGHDIWLTRNHHGAGFWDGDYSYEVEEALMKAIRVLKEVNLVLGGDMKLYFE